MEKRSRIEKLRQVARDHLSARCHEEADEALTRVIEAHDPTIDSEERAEDFSNRGRARLSRGLFRLAAADFTSAIDLDPDEPVSYCNRGGCYYRLRSYDKALSNYEYARSIAPLLPPCVLGIGQVMIVKREFRRSVDNFTIALDLIRDQMDAENSSTVLGLVHRRRGFAYCHLGDFEAAEKDFAACFEIEPSFPRLRDDLQLIDGYKKSFLGFFRHLSPIEAVVALARFVEKVDSSGDAKLEACDRVTSFFRASPLEDSEKELGES